MKIFTVITRWVFILCLPLLLLSASIGIAFNSFWIYRYSLDKYDAKQVTGLSQADLDKAARGLISYFDSGSELIDPTVGIVVNGKPFTMFKEEEVIHLKDVKGLVWLDYKILMTTLLYVLGYAVFYLRQRDRWRYLSKSVLIGSGITLGLMLALGIGTLFDFDQLLLQFHLLSFSNDFWELQWGVNYLLLFFPGFEATVYVTLLTVGMALVLAGASWGHLRFNKRDHA